MHRHIGWAVLISEFGHVFCCVLPTVFTVLSFAANIGLVSMAPTWMMDIHEKIHHYELQIVAFSGAILAFGWIAYFYGEKTDCHSAECEHSCNAHKKRNRTILTIASFLFAINLFIYAFVHKNIFNLPYFPSAQETIHKD